MTDLTGVVTTQPTFFYGSRSHYEHEKFAMRTASGEIDVIDNVSIAPPVPVHPGDRVDVRGEVCHDPGGPIIHWTHHDPIHQHADGFILFRGKVYA